MRVPLPEVVQHLDNLLGTADVPDYPGAHNGLQVHADADVSRVVTAVDACYATIEHAVSRQAQLIIVHHGLFWDGDVPVVGRRFKRLHALLTNGIALYSSHLPLDCHPEVGNNRLLADLIGLSGQEPFGDFQGTMIGRIGGCGLSRDALLQAVTSATNSAPHIIATGPDEVRRVAVVTGGGGSMIREAAAAGADTLVTGEGAHHTYFDAEESGINVLYAGHYATEVFGVKALGDHLSGQFGLDTEFFDHPTGL